jgi:hypothetical protein
MAVGEYVSVRSQHELLDYQVELQRALLCHQGSSPEPEVMTGVPLLMGGFESGRRGTTRSLPRAGHSPPGVF